MYPICNLYISASILFEKNIENEKIKHPIFSLINKHYFL